MALKKSTKRVEHVIAPVTTPRNGADPAERSDGTPARKRGAQPGNRNAWRHGATAADLNERRRVVGIERDAHRAAAEREMRDVLRAAGLQSDPLAALVARQVGRLEAMAARLEAFHAKRGHFTKAGDLKPSVTRYTDTVDRLLGEARRLLEQLQAMERPSEPVTVRVIREDRLPWEEVSVGEEPEAPTMEAAPEGPGSRRSDANKQTKGRRRRGRSRPTTGR